MSVGNVAMVTGVSSGIGRETARLLAERGWRVFGTVRNRMLELPGVDFVRMDVTDAGSVAEAVQAVLRHAGRIHAVVNNAGYALAGALEETSVEEAREQFDTNFFGAVRVIQAVLPAMRRQGYGRIVNLSSIVGVIPAPYRGMYTASKHALEGYTETLDHEVRSFGIRAVLIEPGFTRTDLARNERFTQDAIDAYAEQRRRVQETIERKLAAGRDVGEVAETVYRAITARSPRPRYPAGEAVALSRLRRFLPAALFDRGLRKEFHLDDNAWESNRRELVRGGRTQ